MVFNDNNNDDHADDNDDDSDDDDDDDTVSNGNRTEWSPIRSVIIRVINKIGRPRSGSPICLMTSMITDRIGRQEVLLPINHNHHNFRENKWILYSERANNTNYPK